MIGETKPVMDNLPTLSNQTKHMSDAKPSVSNEIQRGTDLDDILDGPCSLPDIGGGSMLPSCPYCGRQFPEATASAFMQHQQLCKWATQNIHSNTASQRHVPNNFRPAQRVTFKPYSSVMFAGGARTNFHTRPLQPSLDRRGSKFGYCTRNQKLLYKEHSAIHKKHLARQKRLYMRKCLDEMDRAPRWTPQREAKKVPKPEPHPSEQHCTDTFFGALGLISNSSADCVREEAKHHDVDLDCQIIAVEGPIMQMHSPRTTRSLLQQTRRSMDEAKRRLSFCAENGDYDEFEVAAARNHPAGSLLNIPISSPLGVKLKKHMKKDPAVIPGSIDEADIYCLTSVVIDEFSSKLRQRTNEYPVIKGKRKCFVTGSCHTFKFNGSERREFMRTLATGLNRESRRLKLQCKKCVVKLFKLRPEEIRHWTTRRRTIVNQEIEIDDDLSIVQVEVPEDIFTHIQKMPVPLMEKRESAQRYGPYPVSASARNHPYQSSAFSGARTSHSPPKPQYLVERVNQSWTENGREKHMFVPLDGSVQHSNLVVRSMTPSNPGPRPSGSSSSTGVQKSLPKHLRPCPKSRKLVQAEEDWYVNTESSSEEDTGGSSQSASQPQAAVYPLTLSRTSDNLILSPWSMPDHPVPQMLHVVNHESSASSMPLSNMVPGSFPTDLHHLQIKDGVLHQYVPNSVAASLEPQIVASTADGSVSSGCDWMVTIDSVYSAADLTNSQLAASLNLPQEHVPRVVDSALRQQPNFLLQPSPLHRQHHPHFLHPPQASHPPSRSPQFLQQADSRSQLVISNLPVFSAHHIAQEKHGTPKPDSSNSTGRSSSINHHQPNILRTPAALPKLPPPPLPSPPPPPLPSPPPPPLPSPPLLKRHSPSPHPQLSASSKSSRSSFKEWKVRLASDDDIVEIIHIDDD